MEGLLYKVLSGLVEKIALNPDELTDDQREFITQVRSKLSNALAFSDHVNWKVQWRVEKFHAKSIFDALDSGEQPYEVCSDVQNIILDTGANEMLKLICGLTSTAFSAANAKMYVGSDSTAESASQTGVLATTNKAYASMDSGYPQVSGRTMIFRASFDDATANFAWNEAAIANGTGANAISMNRKVTSLGTKTTGTWTLQLTITLAAA